MAKGPSSPKHTTSKAAQSPKHPTPVKTHRAIKISSRSPRSKGGGITHAVYFKIENGHGAEVFFMMPLKGKNHLASYNLPFYKPVADELDEFIERDTNPVQLVLPSLKMFLSSSSPDELWESEDDNYRNNLVAFVGTSGVAKDERDFASSTAKDIVDLMNDAHNNHKNKFPAKPWILEPLTIPNNKTLTLNSICYEDEDVWSILDLLFDFNNSPENWRLALNDDATLQMTFGLDTPLEEAKSKFITLKENYSTTILGD